MFGDEKGGILVVWCRCEVFLGKVVFKSWKPGEWEDREYGVWRKGEFRHRFIDVLPGLSNFDSMKESGEIVSGFKDRFFVEEKGKFFFSCLLCSIYLCPQIASFHVSVHKGPLLLASSFLLFYCETRYKGSILAAQRSV